MYFAFKFKIKVSQKEIYFNPSMVKSIDELHWLHKNNAEILWIFKLKNTTDDFSFTNDMLIEKLLKNPKVLGMDISEVSVLHANQSIRWGVLKKMMNVKHVVLFGISPAELGIQHHFTKYQNRTIGSTTFLWADAPDELPGLAAEWKGKLVKELQVLKQNHV